MPDDLDQSDFDRIEQNMPDDLDKYIAGRRERSPEFKQEYEVLEAIASNNVLASVQALLIAQTAKGLAKYGHSVEPEALSELDWLDHLQQELLDAIVYIECLKQRV